jgi:hypothetical protein
MLLSFLAGQIGLNKKRLFFSSDMYARQSGMLVLFARSSPGTGNKKNVSLYSIHMQAVRISLPLERKQPIRAIRWRGSPRWG